MSTMKHKNARGALNARRAYHGMVREVLNELNGLLKRSGLLCDGLQP